MSLKLSIAEVRTTSGPISIVVAQVPQQSSKPVVIMLHGMMRDVRFLMEWYALVPRQLDLVLVDLPGHGRSPANGASTVDAMTSRVSEVIASQFAGREVVVIGESLGGLIALSLAGRGIPEIRGVVASDPPLSTAKQWAVYSNFMDYTHETAPIAMTEVQRAIFADVLGIVGKDHVRETLYYDLVRAVRVPTLMLMGDVPLFPATPTRPAVPTVLDEVDRYVIGLIGNRHVRLETVPNKGHVLLDQPVPALRDPILKFCEAVLPVAVSAPAAADRLVF
jgi:pimeloyl-ACP methyl ester carboxylesterase